MKPVDDIAIGTDKLATLQILSKKLMQAFTEPVSKVQKLRTDLESALAIMGSSDEPPELLLTANSLLVKARAYSAKWASSASS